jgi:hypothetical protein
MVQVFGLLIVEFIAFLAIIKLRPFEGQRLNVIMVYLLGFSKVATVALSAAFDVDFNLGRITTTAIGIVIIVIQGIITIVLMICIVLSAITSYFSITRYREEIRPKKWNPYRERYFKHLDRAVRDRPATPPPAEPTPPPEEPKGPYFSVNSVRRAPKIEDEDPEFLAEIARDPRLSMDPQVSGTAVNNNDNFNHNQVGTSTRASRAFSTSSRRSATNLPYAARVHRGSWSVKDFGEFNDGLGGDAVTATPMGDNDGVQPASRQYSALRSHASRDSMRRAAHSRNASATVAEEMGRLDVVSPMHHSALSTPTISRSTSLREPGSTTAAIETLGDGASSATTPDDDKKKPLPINTAIPRTADITNLSPSPSPRSPGRTRSTLQKHRPGESIDEGKEG